MVIRHGGDASPMSFNLQDTRVEPSKAPAKVKQKLNGTLAKGEHLLKGTPAKGKQKLKGTPAKANTR